MTDLPDSNPKTRFGVAKPGIADIPTTALLHCGLAMRDGQRKYGRTNWREHEVTASVYYEAMFRHAAAWWEREQNAEDSGVHHLGHSMACLAILLDAEYNNALNDDRPSVASPFSDLVKALTVPLEPKGPAVSEMDRTPYDPNEPLELDPHWASDLVDTPEEADFLDAVVDGEVGLGSHVELAARIDRDAEEIALRVLSTGTLDDAKEVIASYLTGQWEPEDDDDEGAEEAEQEPEETGQSFVVKSGGLGFQIPLRTEITEYELRDRIAAFLRTQSPHKALAQYASAQMILGHNIEQYEQRHRVALCFMLDAWANKVPYTATKLFEVIEDWFAGESHE